MKTKKEMPVKLNYKYLAVDQRCEIVFIERNPRKELKAFHPGHSIHIMYCENAKDTSYSYKCGYIIDDHWYTVYKISPFTHNYFKTR